MAMERARKMMAGDERKEREKKKGRMKGIINHEKMKKEGYE